MLFTLRPLLCADLILNEFTQTHSAHWSNDRMLILNVASNSVANSTQRHVPSIHTPRSSAAFALIVKCTSRSLSDGTPANIRIYFVYLAIRIIRLHFAADNMEWIHLHLNCYGGLRKNILFLQERRFGRSRSSKVIDFRSKLIPQHPVDISCC